jgi:heme exporter protein C
MRKQVLIGLSGIALLLLLRNLYVMFVDLPDEAQQGPIFRIIFFHVPVAWTALLCALFAAGSSVMYLVSKDLKYDAFAVAVTEAGLAFGAANLVSGMIWGRQIWGIWWAWDPRLTSMLICELLYAGYLMLRSAIDDPTQRARIAAVLSIFAFSDVPIVVFSIKWWRTQHPQPVVWGGGKMDSAYYNMLFANWIPILLLAVVMIAIRMRQERIHREVEALRRYAHEF